MEVGYNDTDDFLNFVKAPPPEAAGGVGGASSSSASGSGTPTFTPSETFVSNETREMAEIVIDLCISFVIANVGIVSNIVVIVVFARQGYAESMNVSMTAIALWDLLKCISGSVQRMSGPISLVSGAYAESWVNVMTVAMNYFISFASYVSSVLAAYVAVERCLCVTLPFTVKTLFTPKVTLVAMVTISVVVFGAFAVVFGIYDIVWTYSPEWNTTIAVYRYSQFFETHRGPLMDYYNMSGVIWPTLSFIVIVVCTVIIFYQLREASRFRKKGTGTGNGSHSISTSSSATVAADSRDRQVIKMLLVIIIIYIVNLFPRIAIYFAKLLIDEFYFLRQYHNLFVLLTYWILLFDLTNATVNLYVFLAMSSNFRATAKAIFGLGDKDKQGQRKK